MTGGTSNGDAIALGLWAWAVAGIPLFLYAAKARWRAHLPERARRILRVPCEGDTVTCPHCGEAAAAEVWDHPDGADGRALYCGECGAVLDLGEGLIR